MPQQIICRHPILKDKNICFADTEFFNSQNMMVEPVCASLVYHNPQGIQHTVRDWWVHSIPRQHVALAAAIRTLSDLGYVFASYSVEAECRFFSAIGVDYRKLKWIDLWVEYQMLMNKNNEIAYGKQLVKGKVLFTRPKSRDEDEQEGEKHNQAETGLVAATYKLLGIHRDSAHKKTMRDLIINGGPFNEAEAKAIQAYCQEDTVLLPQIFDEILERYQAKLSQNHFKNIWEQMLGRGEYAMRSAQMVILGYPADVPKVKALSKNIPHIKHELALDVNKIISQKYGFKPFKFLKKEMRFGKDMGAISTALLKEYPDWPKTETGTASISSEVLAKYCTDRHAFKNSLPSQLSRVQQLEAALRGFEQKRDASKKNLIESIGSDGRVRPYFGIFRSQSSRSQPQASGFLFLKSAWIRCLVQPHESCYIGAVDYGAQEFLIAACMSNDRAMIADYETGDPYIAFGKRVYIIPHDGDKKTHKVERAACKALILGSIYGLGAVNMAARISEETEKPCSVEQARDYLYKLRSTYPKYVSWRKEIADDYVSQGYLQLCDGWTMWGDNDNPLSVQNCPIQGTGAVVMRRAVKLSQEAQIKVIKTLHDALYNEGYVSKGLQDLDKMARLMQQAWKQIGRQACGRDVPDIRLEAFAWGPKLKEEGGLYLPCGVPLDTAPIYIDERAKKEYENYSKYLVESVDDQFSW